MYFATEGKSTSEITDKAVFLLGGYTLTKHQGGWEGANHIVEEESFSLEFINLPPINKEIRELANYIKDKFNQSEVWVTEQEIINTMY
jgi:hypothetical protein